MSQMIIEITEGRVYEPFDPDVMQAKRETHFEDLSFKFVREANALFGGDKAAELAQAVKEILGKEWSQRLILRMLSNEGGSDYHVNFNFMPHNFGQPIQIIKAIRMGSGLGLRESKDAYEKLRGELTLFFNRHPHASLAQAPCIRLYVSPIRYEDVVREVKLAGATIL